MVYVDESGIMGDPHQLNLRVFPDEQVAARDHQAGGLSRGDRAVGARDTEDFGRRRSKRGEGGLARQALLHGFADARPEFRLRPPESRRGKRDRNLGGGEPSHMASMRSARGTAWGA